MAFLWDLIGHLEDGSVITAARFTSYERANEYLARSKLSRPTTRNGNKRYTFKSSSLISDCVSAEISKTTPDGPPLDPVPPGR